jgi:leucyl aminopeptidase
MSLNLITSTDSTPTIITIVQPSFFEEWKEKLSKEQLTWIMVNGFSANSDLAFPLPSYSGEADQFIYLVNKDARLWDWATLPVSLSSGIYALDEDGLSHTDLYNAALAWSLATYSYSRYRSSNIIPPKLLWPKHCDRVAIEAAATSSNLVRDLINAPANDMGPEELATAAETLSKDYGAEFSVIVGDDLIKQNYPTIHAVGRAHDRAPRLVDIRWGKATDRKLTLVGKGVCFDTGGLDLKPASGMELMKKDMGGAANVLGLARMIMAAKLQICLRVLIPAVENSVSANAMRPGDVIDSRKGITIEIGNTDAEGRVILADALCEAATENPEVIIDFATLTGAARVALGTDLPALFVNDDRLAEELLTASKIACDPLWRMPLWDDYNSQITGKIADITNSPSGRFGGAITAALFLQRFIKPHIAWAHIDLIAWNLSERPGRPEGGEAMGMRAVFNALEKRFG